MHSLSILVFIVVCTTVAYCKPAEKYTNKYDGVDLDAVIRNERLLRNYVDCMLEKKKCSKDGAELKKHLSEALANDCLKCNEFQRNGSRKMLTHLITNQRDWFVELEAKYDSAHIFRQRHEAEIKKAGVILR